MAAKNFTLRGNNYKVGEVLYYILSDFTIMETKVTSLRAYEPPQAHTTDSKVKSTKHKMLSLEFEDGSETEIYNEGVHQLYGRLDQAEHLCHEFIVGNLDYHDETIFTQLEPTPATQPQQPLIHIKNRIKYSMAALLHLNKGKQL